MRNLLLYPITTGELVDLLRGYLFEYEAWLDTIREEEQPIGDMKPLLLEEAIRRLREQDMWCVTRAGDDGNPVTVRQGMQQRAANQLYEFLTEKGHKQTYLLHRESERTDENFLNKPAKTPK